MERHYRETLSMSIGKILLLCDFKNTSKRAFDELVGLTLNYMRNITSKISALKDQCNPLESDVLIGLCAFKLHGENLEELFSFYKKYNVIFPPQPKVYYGPIPLKSAQKPREDKPDEIVPWAPDMTQALSTIGMKLKNRQIISDPNFDRSKFLALSIKSPVYNSDNKSHILTSQSSTASNAVVKYGSNCSYHLPPEAYPHKYEAPTIDLDTNGVLIGLNGRCGKLPDPYINELEEQDILRQKSKFTESHVTKLKQHTQLLNGIRKKEQAIISEDSHRSDSPLLKRKLQTENSIDASSKKGTPTSEHYKSNHIDKAVTSDDAWNAALQATVTTIIKPDPYVMTFNDTDSALVPSIPFVKKHKKRHRSPSESRPKKIRRIVDKIEDDVSQIYQNESTMDSRFSDAVPYSSSPDRESNYNNTYFENYQTHQIKEKSPSYSPLLDSRPDSIQNNPGSHISYYSEFLPSHSFLSTSKSKKKKSTRKTHFTNKRKKKPPQSSTVNYQYQLDSVELNDNDSIERRSLAFSYNPHSQTPSPCIHIETCVEDSDDDGTEPMKESSEEMLRMLEIPDSNHIQNYHNDVVDSPPYPVLNNKYNHGLNNVVHGNSNEGGIRMKIKLFKTNSDTNRANSYVNSVNTDLSSPPQSLQHSDDKNSISERLKFMRDDESPLSDNGRGVYQHSAFDKSPDQSHYEVQRDSPSMSSTQGSYKDFYVPANSVVSGVVSSAFSQSNTPLKFIHKSVEKLRRKKSGSSHSSPKTLPAQDDCDNKIPSLLFKTTKSSKKRKKSRINSSSKKSKSKKSTKLMLEKEMPIQKTIEPTFISVDDVFSDEDDNIKVEPNHHSIPLSAVIAQTYSNEQPMHHIPIIIDKSSPYRLPIPTMKINSKKSTSKPKKTKTALISSVLIKHVEPKIMYNYSCLQGEAHYASEDGKIVYICPICNTEDNGSLMLLCDLCEDWYHGLCLGIFDAPPEHLEWFCPRCIDDRISGQLNTSKTKSIKSRTKKK